MTYRAAAEKGLWVSTEKPERNTTGRMARSRHRLPGRPILCSLYQTGKRPPWSKHSLPTPSAGLSRGMTWEDDVFISWDERRRGDSALMNKLISRMPAKRALLVIKASALPVAVSCSSCCPFRHRA